MSNIINKTHIAYWEGKGWAVYTMNIESEVKFFSSYDEAYSYWVEILSGECPQDIEPFTVDEDEHLPCGMCKQCTE